jgi:hypothetical protein
MQLAADKALCTTDAMRVGIGGVAHRIQFLVLMARQCTQSFQCTYSVPGDAGYPRTIANRAEHQCTLECLSYECAGRSTNARGR